RDRLGGGCARIPGRRVRRRPGWNSDLHRSERDRQGPRRTGRFPRATRDPVNQPAPTLPATRLIAFLLATLMALTPVAAAAGPPQMLPPELGTMRLVAMDLTKAEDQASEPLQDALIRGTPFACALLSLGRTSTLAYAHYAFEHVTLLTIQSSLDSEFKMRET